jgi:VanZ family protein
VNRYFVSDLIVNIALYVPVGMSGYFVFRSQGNVVPGLAGPVLFAAAMSSSIEMLQIFVPQRHCSALDVITNVIGSIVGVMAGLLFQELAETPASLSKRSTLQVAWTTDSSALTLLFGTAAYWTAPFFPAIGRTLVDRKLQILLHSPVLQILPFLSAAALWFACGLLLEAANLEPAGLLLGVSVLVVPLQLVIISRQPVPSDFLGAVAGSIAFGYFGGARRAVPIVAGAFLGLLLLRGLAPFHFQSAMNYFTWIPFGGFLNMNWQHGLILILEKMVYYGIAIWLLHAAGIRLVAATLIVAAILGCVEVAQIHLPGRTAETTDPVVALLIGLAMKTSQGRVLIPSARMRTTMRRQPDATRQRTIL